MMWVDLSPKQEEKMMHRHAYSLSLSPTKQKIETDSIDNRARKPQRLQARQRKNIRGKMIIVQCFILLVVISITKASAIKNTVNINNHCVIIG